MAYRTPDDAAGPSGRAPLDGGAGARELSAFVASADAPVMLPSGQFASDAAYRQQGDDLVLTAPDGKTIVVEGYFRLDPPPDLLTPEGGRLTPAMVDSFTPSEALGQYAQAGQLAQAAEPIGQVSELSGSVFAVRADGTRVQLAAGDAVFQGDVVETAAGGAINMIFVDNTTFALGADARLALDEMVYNPATQSGSSSFSVLKGVFVFVSGQIAQTDNTQMTVTTPVATIGIRGTKVAGDVRPAGEESRFTVIDGEIAISTQGGTVVMSQANATKVITNFLAPPSPPVVYTVRHQRPWNCLT
ncbi:MAG: FecR domain-containing protein [Proteobacteria bacterium]|nr:FecR domain-containing protein [Pseudomonadota bacterium]